LYIKAKLEKYYHFIDYSCSQFNYYLTRGCQTNPFQLQLLSDWMMADRLFWRWLIFTATLYHSHIPSKDLAADANIWGTPVGIDNAAQ
jgi:hypothetical protein